MDYFEFIREFIFYSNLYKILSNKFIIYFKMRVKFI